MEQETYIILSANEIDALESLVQFKMKESYSPQGGVCTDRDGTYYQAMILVYNEV